MKKHIKVTTTQKQGHLGKNQAEKVKKFIKMNRI